MNSWALWAVIGAVGALGIREWVEHLMRVAEKRRNCHHDFLTKDDTDWGGFKTQHCHKCGYQEDVPRRDKKDA